MQLLRKKHPTTRMRPMVLVMHLLEETECTAAWCSVDNWQPLTCGVYFYRKLK